MNLSFQFDFNPYILQVIQGLLQANEAVIVGKDNCAQLFAHEATRVFHDRLVSPEDRRTFFQILSDNLHNYFKVRIFIFRSVWLWIMLMTSLWKWDKSILLWGTLAGLPSLSLNIQKPGVICIKLKVILLQDLSDISVK